MAESDFDLELLGMGEVASEPVEPELVDSEPVEVADVVDVVEPVEPVVAAEIAPEAEVDERPLSPRERTLIERLERVTGERLDAIPATPPAEESPPVSSEDTINFLEGLDLDEVFSTPEGVNSLLLSVYNRGVEHSSKAAAENIMRSLPQIISQYVTQQVSMTERVNQFYAENPELKTVRKTVASVANEISAENPELELEQVFDQSAERVYKMLGLKKGQIVAPTTPAQLPKSALVTPRSSGNRMKVPELQGLEAEITDLLEL